MSIQLAPEHEARIEELARQTGRDNAAVLGEVIDSYFEELGRINATLDRRYVYRDDRVTVDAFRVPHGKWEHAFGFRFRTPDKVIVISGDTAFTPAIAEQCNGCDILLHEGGFSDNSAYFRESHTSAEELARVASAAKPKLLVLYHQRNANGDGVRIIRSGFQGPVVVASDLQVFE
jgi:ribonuclease Z